MFSAVLPTCLLLRRFGVSSRACVWPHHLFLIQSLKVNSCLGRRLMRACTHTHTYSHTHIALFIGQVGILAIHSVTIRMILYLPQFASSVAANARRSCGGAAFLAHTIIIKITVGHKASNCFFICSVIDCVDWLTHSEQSLSSTC